MFNRRSFFGILGGLFGTSVVKAETKDEITVMKRAIHHPSFYGNDLEEKYTETLYAKNGIVFKTIQEENDGEFKSIETFDEKGSFHSFDNEPAWIWENSDSIDKSWYEHGRLIKKIEVFKDSKENNDVQSS